MTPTSLKEKHDAAKFFLTAAGNVSNPALLILQEKGYELGFDSEWFGGTWWAWRDGNLFEADDCLLLLAIVTVWENRGENWQNRDEEPFLWDDLQQK